MTTAAKLTAVTAVIYLAVATPLHAQGLAEVYLLAQKQDPIIKQAEANYHAAAQARPLARAALLPQISFSAENSENRLEVKGNTFGVPGSKVDYNTKGYQLGLTQSLYNRDFYIQLRQSKNIVARAQIEWDLSKQDLMIRLIEAYFNVLSARDTLTYARAEKRAIGRQLEQAENRFEVGLSAITDVKDAQSSYDLSVAQEIAASTAPETSLDNLAMMTGERLEMFAQRADNINPVVPEPADIQTWLDTALTQNLRLLINEYETTIAQQDIKRSQSGYYPTLDIVASHSDVESGGLTGDRESKDSKIGLELNFPIFRGGGTYYQTKESRFLYQASLQAHEQIKREVTRDTRQAYHNVVAGVSQVQALAKALESAQVSAEANEIGFEVGTRTTIDVLLSLRAVYQAQRDLSRARYDHLIDTLQLKYAAGTLNNEDIMLIDQAMH